jgi:hypothetical protein
MYHAIALFVALLCSGCVYKQGPASVTYGLSKPVDLVRIKRDKTRWYLSVPTETFGERLFFLDTGYANTTCDDDFIKALGLETHGRVVIYGESGKTIATKAILPPFELGGHRIEKVVCTVRDLNTTSSIRDPKDFSIAGVLGMDVLRRFRAHFKPQEAHVRLLNPRELPALEAGSRLRREYGFGLRATVQVQLNDHRRWLIIDTGASITLANARGLHLSSEAILSTATLTGSGTGRAPKSIQRLHLNKLGFVGHENGEGELYDRRRGPFFPGLLGLNVLGQYDQLYDWQHRRALFSPVEAKPLPIYTPSLNSE